MVGASADFVKLENVSVNNEVLLELRVCDRKRALVVFV